MMSSNENDPDIIIHPDRGKSEKKLPPTGFFLTNPGEAGFAQKNLRRSGGIDRSLFHSNLCISQKGDFFVAGPAVGSPLAVLCLEKLIALGAERIVLVSCCGCVAPNFEVGDVIVPEQAVSGEGTSRYYDNDKKLKPSDSLISGLKQFLLQEEIDFHGGAIWSTDAPYRERRTELARLRSESGIVGVDMEFSALCAAANFREIFFAGVFVVSDRLLTKKWQPGFNSNLFRDQSENLISKLLTGKASLFDFR